jgi:Trypsin-like peptidase domain
MAKTQTLSATLTRGWALLRSLLLSAAVAAIALAGARSAHASSNVCATGSACSELGIGKDERYFRFSTAIGQPKQREGALRRLEYSDEDYPSFSGVGLIVCTVDGERRSSTAFLVGSFDLAVTVAHTFGEGAQQAEPADCNYNSMDALGQVRERIPLAYIRSEWQTDIGAKVQPAKDFAVVRLSEPSRYAQRTMPLGRFSGAAAPVVMVGFKSDVDTDTVKRKARGTVYERRDDGVAISSLTGFTHDMDSRGIAAGAPVVDERSGVIIGIHTRLGSGRNTMVTMNDWLEATLREEMQAQHSNAVEPRPDDAEARAN